MSIASISGAMPSNITIALMPPAVAMSTGDAISSPAAASSMPPPASPPPPPPPQPIANTAPDVEEDYWLQDAPPPSETAAPALEPQPVAD